MPLVWFAIVFASGIIFAYLIPLPTWIWVVGVALSVIIFALFRIKTLNASFFPFTSYIPYILIFSFSIFRYQVSQPVDDSFHLIFYNDRDYEMLVTGSLYEPPDYRDTYTNVKIKVEAVDSGSGDLPVSGFLLARVPANVEYEYGQRVRLRGSLETPPENEEFSYRDYLAREGIHSILKNAEVTELPGNSGGFFWRGVYTLKENLVNTTYRIFADPEASLLAGILFGVDTGLTKDLQNAFKRTGTSHIIAISGFNIAIIAGVFFALFKNIFGERLGAVFAITGIILYTILVGADAAVVRAAIMGILSLTARQIGRRNNGLNALGFAVILMLAYNPLFLWDVGFQLSFFATLGLILYAEPFSNFTSKLFARFSGKDNGMIVNIINDNIMLTFAAQLTTIPIMAYYFKQISLISFIVNPFVLPVQPAVMILGGIAVFTGLVVQPLGQALAWLAFPFVSYTIHIIEFFNNAPVTVLYLDDSSLGFTVFTYAALFGLTFGWPAIKERFQALSDSLRPIALTATLAGLFVCVTLVWQASANSGDGQLHITFLDVGSADAVLIQTPEGRNVLINGGAQTAELSDELGRRLPFFSRKLDWLIVASTEENQLAALPRIVERYPPENVLWSGNEQASFPAQALDEYFSKQGIPVTRAEAGQKLQLGEDSFVEILAEGPRGSVVLIQYRNFSAVLPIGANESAYESIEYGNMIGKADVLLLADSGYAPANPPDLIENLNPQLIILSVAAGDPNGLPSQDVIDGLEGYSLLRTDLSGWISIATDGNEMRVTVERKE